MKFHAILTTAAILSLLAAPALAADHRDGKTHGIETKRAIRDLSSPASRTQKGDAQKLKQALRGLKPADALSTEMTRLGRQLQALKKGSKGKRSEARKTAEKINKIAADLQRGFAGIDVAEAKAGKATAAKLSNKIDDILRDLEAEDKMGNFEIQDLMSRFNQAETLASQVQKKKDDTENAVINKI